jgi:CRISPR-associated protein (TIGR03985 family)
MIWQDSPSVPLLQWLARGSLKQNLLQAIRLWVWLHLLYGKPGVKLDLPDPFSYADWRTVFFSHSHPVTDNSPILHDVSCPCAKVAADWLFDPDFNLMMQGQRGHNGHGRQEQTRLFEQALLAHNVLPTALPELLQSNRLFAVTGRTLRNDLKILVDIHWLQSVGQKYRRVNQFPDRPLNLPDAVEDGFSLGVVPDFLTQPDLAAIASNLSQVLNQHRRFFVHVEYVVSAQRLDSVDEWQAQLRDLWKQTPILPIQIDYTRARRPHPWQGIVFPVCIYYYQRGPYLCAFGQYPDAPDDRLDWRNYRLDRMTQLSPLRWDDSQIPALLRLLYQQNKLPTPDEIQLRMDEAWGFDYYQPIQQLLVRFDRTWDERYIRNSFRHPTFQRLPYDQVGSTIQQALQGKSQQSLLQIWRSRSDQDAYYQVNIRENDPNIWQRLRAWRPHIEVLLPWELRQQFAQEVQAEGRLYEG